MTNTQLKTQIDIDITNKTISKSISTTNVGKNIKDVVDYVDQEKRPYKVYTALLTQIGIDAPTAIILENTLGEPISFGYVGVGIYSGTIISSLFTINKTTVTITNGATTPACFGAYSNSLTGIQIGSVISNNAGESSNNLLWRAFFEIRVYN